MAKKFATFAHGTPVNAVNATKLLTLTGVVVDGEKITVDNPLFSGSDVYEFLADTAQTKTTPTNKAVSIVANTTKATGTLTVATQPTAADTMTIGTKVYTFIANNATQGNGKIRVGTDLASAKLAIVAAINGTDTFNTAHPLVSASAFATNDCTLTALVGGVAGNSVATTETFTAVGNVFGAATLGSGADCTAANAIVALLAAATASNTQGVTLTAGAGTTVNFNADYAGAAGNKIVVGKTLANATFAGGATKLSGGVDGTEGEHEQIMLDSSYLYVCVDKNTKAGKGWRRVSIGSAF
jgi:hypothetical protein